VFLREKKNHIGYLEALLLAEVEERERNTIERRIREAHLPRMKTLEEFDYTQSPNVNAAKMRDLAEGGYIDRAEPVLFIGECGTGASPFAIGFLKQHLAWRTVAAYPNTRSAPGSNRFDVAMRRPLIREYTSQVLCRGKRRSRPPRCNWWTCLPDSCAETYRNREWRRLSPFHNDTKPYLRWHVRLDGDLCSVSAARDTALRIPSGRRTLLTIQWAEFFGPRRFGRAPGC